MSPATLTLPYKPPLDWNALLSTFRAHQLPHLELVDESAYERVTETTSGSAWVRAEHHPEENAILLSVSAGTEQELEAVGQRIRRMFDLDADPQTIGQVMLHDPYLNTLWQRYPGLRVARTWSGFETILTTILGQLVSVSFGRVLIDELMQTVGTATHHPRTGKPIHLFPTPEQLLNADLGPIRTSNARRAAIRFAAQIAAAGCFAEDRATTHQDLRKTLLSIPGVGPWTAEYVAMRGFGDDDAFPKTDYGLKQALKRHPQIDVNRVRPWRAYAAALLWRDFAASKRGPDESLV